MMADVYDAEPSTPWAVLVHDASEAGTVHEHRADAPGRVARRRGSSVTDMTEHDALLAAANAVRLAVGVLNRRVRDEIENGLSPSETVVLSRLDRNGPESIADLARREHVTPQAMGATVGGLEARGLLQRAPDPTDGRRAMLSPTSEGHALIRSRQDAVTKQLADALGEHFEPDEIERIRIAALMIERLAHLI